MERVRVQITRNGPIVITGPVELVDAQGTPIPVKKEQVIALCRCGQSATKPLCDGSHSRCGFDGTLNPGG